MFSRIVTDNLLKAVEQMPAVSLTGVRQCGKTTILKELFPSHVYLSLENPNTLKIVKDDPISYFADLNTKWIIDEAQNYPELFSYLQGFIDENPIKGRFILSGSQNFLLSDNISQSLAGRIAVLELLPLTHNEFITHDAVGKYDIWEYLYNGSYPRPYNENIDIKTWYASYIKTYIERDVRALVNIDKLDKFQLFLSLLAARNGQLLNLSSIAGDCGVSKTTIDYWLKILEESYLVFLLRPYYKNFKKRLVKTPKVYFYDTSIVCQLLSIESPEHLKIHSARGAIFEGFVVSELLKVLKYKSYRPSIFFFRDYAGQEVDIIIETPNENIAIEVKSSSTYDSSFLDVLNKWSKLDEGNKIKKLVYSGQENRKIKDVQLISWDKVVDALK